MAFALAGLSHSMASGKGLRLWGYLSLGETLATIRGANYFDSVANATRFKVGDVILVVGSDGFGMNVIATVTLPLTVTLDSEDVSSA